MKHFFFVSSRIHSVYSDLLTIGCISLYSADIRENDKQKKFVVDLLLWIVCSLSFSLNIRPKFKVYKTFI